MILKVRIRKSQYVILQSRIMAKENSIGAFIKIFRYEKFFCRLTSNNQLVFISFRKDLTSFSLNFFA